MQVSGGKIVGKIRRSVGIGAVVVVVVAAGIVALAKTGGVKSTPRQISDLSPITSNFNVSVVPVSAPAAILIDAENGQVLYAKNSLQQHYPASLVKLMTSLIALDMVKKGTLKYQSLIPVSQSAYQLAITPGLSVAYLNPSEKITLSKMLEYMYVVSADDAAVALADAIAGNQPKFAKLMNEKAMQLGLTGTHYTNASGLQDPKQFTNAYDVAKISQYLIQNDPIVLKYASEPGMYIHPGQYGYTYDQLLGQYKGLDGLKTGSTNQAGYCFSGTAEQHGHRLISVVLDANSFANVFQDTENLLNYGFRFYRSVNFQAAGQPLGVKLTVKDGQNQALGMAPKSNVLVDALGGKIGAYSTEFLPSVAHAPIAAGERVGTEDVFVKNHIILQVPVYALQADPKAGLITKSWRLIMNHLHQVAAKIVNWAVLKLSHL